MKLEASALPAVTLAGQDISFRDAVHGKDVHKCKLSIFGADDFVTSEDMCSLSAELLARRTLEPPMVC